MEINNVHTRVYIGDTEAGRHLGLDPDHLPRETFVLRSLGNDLFIAGREDDGDPFAEDNPNTGPLFGMYEFLGRRTWPMRNLHCELVAFRKENQQLFFSDLLWVTSYWERPKLNLDELMDAIN